MSAAATQQHGLVETGGIDHQQQAPVADGVLHPSDFVARGTIGGSTPSTLPSPTALPRILLIGEEAHSTHREEGMQPGMMGNRRASAVAPAPAIRRPECDIVPSPDVRSPC